MQGQGSAVCSLLFLLSSLSLLSFQFSHFVCAMHGQVLAYLSSFVPFLSQPCCALEWPADSGVSCVGSIEVVGVACAVQPGPVAQSALFEMLLTVDTVGKVHLG